MTTAPIAVFCYRRPEHLRNTLQSLMQCSGFSQSRVFVFGDGPKSDADRADVLATREVARDILGDAAEYRFSEINRGLSASIIAGIEEVLTEHDRVIVVEDDLVLNPRFLRYMNSALDAYAGENCVFQVSGYLFNSPGDPGADRAFFLPFTTSWGWATWRRAWACFDSSARGWQRLKTDSDLRRRFNLGGAYDYSTMLERQMEGKRDSWAIRWYWSVFSVNGLVLFPPASLVRNEGMDGSGTHGGGLFSRFKGRNSEYPVSEIHFPEEVALKPESVQRVIQVLRWQNGGWRTCCLDLLRRFLGR
ncbi:MAG: glycosyltransferase [Betaproteobacteria bacterium]|nr:glycosyltransferase [Betaproteobacteria bacterium]